MIKVKMIKDSVAPSKIRLSTMLLTYPRVVHAEFMTHRVFSRNSASSRAIPVVKMIDQVEKNPYVPNVFYENQKGMQGGDPLPKDIQIVLRNLWLDSKNLAVMQARKMLEYKAAKQHINRILEPYFHISVVVTSTHWANFFALRHHPDADPEIQSLAAEMYKVYSESKPKFLKKGEWHLPFVDFDRPEECLTPDILNEFLLKCSAARCARTSYLNHDGNKISLKEDLDLYSRLVDRFPVHSSPTEHQAQATDDPKIISGNFHGWLQHRKLIPNENVSMHNHVNDNEYIICEI